MLQKVKNTIPVYDISALAESVGHLHESIIAEPFASYLKVHPNLTSPHRHNFYHIVLFTAGSGTHSIDFEQFPVCKGQVYFMRPGQVHSWNFIGTPDGFVINFSEPLFADFLNRQNYLDHFSFFSGNAAESVVSLAEPSYTQVLNIAEQVTEEVNKAGSFAMDMIRALLVTLFITVSREQPGIMPDRPIPQNLLILNQFRLLLEKHYQEMRLPRDYAEMLYITPNHLNSLCKEVLGKPAGEVIRSRILLETQRLLVNLEISIADIALRNGFTDNDHFTKFFKKETGYTPDEFRRNNCSLNK